MKILKRIFWFALLAAIGIVAMVILFLFFQKPKYSGTVRMPDLDSTITTYFDPYGIPHIYAKNEEDAFRALGYIHAQERLFQIELIRRVSAGRLSEVFGSKTLEVDKFFRMLGIAQHAERSADVFLSSPDSQVKKDVLAYLTGLNQYILKGKKRMEFLMLNIPREPYTVKDLFLVVDYMSFNFQMGFKTDPVLTRIQKTLGENYLNDILKSNQDTSSLLIDSLAIPSIEKQMSFISELEEILPVKIWSGSNAWALSGNRSVSGKALLENDTHIGIQQPAVWYEAHLESPGFKFYGNFLAGFPFAPIGHTMNHGWGLTMLENDDLDFFIEKTNPDDSTLVLSNDHWEKIATRNEVIKVKDSVSVNLVSRSTHHGPICSDVMPEFKTMTTNPVSACWTFLNFNNNLMEATWKLAHSESMVEFREAVSMIAAPGLNIVYADAQNNIAWYTAAKFAIRPVDVDASLLQDGTGANDWQGYYDFDKNPRQENPELGFVLSANNDPQIDTTNIFPGYYVPNDRYVRLRNLLFTKSKFNRDDLERIAIDVKNPVASEISKALISKVSGVSKLKTQIHERASLMLANWDGDHKVTDNGPVVYYKFLYHVFAEAMMDELGEKDFEVFLKTHAQKRMIMNFINNDSSAWWDNKNTMVTETENGVIEKAFDKTVQELIVQLGYNPDKWIWGTVHTIEYEHPLGKQKPLDKIFNIGPFPEMGGMETVNNQSFDLNGNGIYKVNLGPALRRVVDFAEPELGYSINPSGQSGNFISKHYSNQVKLYISGKYRKEMMNKDEIKKVCKDILYFQPLD
ncbi:MAG: penicillin acylase family protein [Bacteroidetes bacterium]|nr:penicillin acylase family protein [Bacteroidota bacterium]